MFEYDVAAMEAVKRLDGYDFTEILSECYDNHIRESWCLKKKIADNYKEIEDALDDLSLYEFMDYLCDRYPIRFETVTTYRMWYK